MTRLTRSVSRLHRGTPWESSWRSRAWREAPPILPPLRFSCSWPLDIIIMRNFWTFPIGFNRLGWRGCSQFPEPPLSPTSPESPLVPSSSPMSTGSPLVPSSSPVSPKLPETPKLPPSLPLPPPLKPANSSALSPLVPVSPSAHPQSAPSGRSDPHRDFQSPAPPRREDPLSLTPASEFWTSPPWSPEPTAPPWPSGSSVTLALRLSLHPGLLFHQLSLC